MARAAMSVLTWSLLTGMPASAQVTLDGTIGPGGSLTGPAYVIPHTVGAVHGSNLFHSFGTFNVRSTESATFTGPASITDVIARVTGGSITTIDGALRSEIGAANLWLLNPAGILFGPNAELDLPASLHVGTADELRFSDGTVFSAAAPGDSVLTTAPPTAFGFLRQSPSTIEVTGAELTLEEGESLSLVGGDLLISGGASIEIESGTVLLVSVSGPGEVSPLAATVSAGTALGPITLDGGAVEEVSDDDDNGDGDDDAPESDIRVSGESAGRFFIRAESLIANGFSIEANSLGDADGASVAIDIALTGTAQLSGETQLASIAEGGATGGDVVLSATTVLMRDDSELLSDTQGHGAGGDVVIHANWVELSDDSEIASDVDEGAEGNAGRVIIRGRIITLSGDSEISSSTGGDGAGGVIDVHATQVIRVLEQAGVFTDAEAGGSAGSILLTAPQVTIDQGLITAATQGSGAGGDITISGGQISLRQGARISAASSGAGPTGRVNLNAGSIVMENAIVSTQALSSDGGDITLIADILVDLLSSDISTSVRSGDGAGGNISIDPDFVILDNARIVANAFGGPGGNIHIVAGSFISSPDSVVDASSALAIDGTVVIDAPETDVANAITTLPDVFLNAEALARAPCAARGADARSSLLPRAHDALPPLPTRYLPSPATHPNTHGATAAGDRTVDRNQRDRSLVSHSLTFGSC